MKIYVRDVKDVELESPVTEEQFVVLVQAWRGSCLHAQLFVTQDAKKGRLDLRDIDIERTLAAFHTRKTDPAPAPDSATAA